ncbi:MAG: IclR family transcriptional regulator [Thermoleophilia bacterium]
MRSVARAAGILEQFTLDRPTLTLTEIATGLELSKSTTHRLLGTLEELGFLELDEATRRYRLGLKLFWLGSVVLKSMELVTQADPVLAALVEETGETAFLVVPDGTEALCLRRLDGRHSVRVLFLETGKRLAFNAGAAPRVLLAHMEPDEWDRIVPAHTRRMTDNTLTTRAELLEDRRRIRELGYAISREDVSLHACAIGAPVYDQDGKVIAAVSVSGIVQRFSGVEVPLLAESIVRAGGMLSRRMGYRGRL